MKLVLGLATLAAATIATPAVAATQFTFDLTNSYVVVAENDTSCIFGSCSLTAGLVSPLSSFLLDVGESYTFDFAQIFVSSGFGTGSATLDAQLAFLTPGTSASGNSGESNYLRLGGIFTPGTLSGSLVWNTPSQQVTTSDGTNYTVSFGNLTGSQFGGNVRAPVTVTLNSVVPEPSTWAMMILGFGLIGLTMRRRRTPVLRPAIA